MATFRTCKDCNLRFSGWKCPRCHPPKPRVLGALSHGGGGSGRSHRTASSILGRDSLPVNNTFQIVSGAIAANQKKEQREMVSNNNRMLALDMIVSDPDLQTRVQMDLFTVGEYADKMAEGANFPPVVVFSDGEHYWLADGFHRVEAARQAGIEMIWAEIHTGGKREALLYSVGANGRHGIRRTDDDKRKAVRMLLADEEWRGWSDRRVAEVADVSGPFVAKIRREMYPDGDPGERLVERGGKVYTMTTANIGREAEPEPALLLAEAAPVVAPAQLGGASAWAPRFADRTASISAQVTDLMQDEPVIRVGGKVVGGRPAVSSFDPDEEAEEVGEIEEIGEETGEESEDDEVGYEEEVPAPRAPVVQYVTPVRPAPQAQHAPAPAVNPVVSRVPVPATAVKPVSTPAVNPMPAPVPVAKPVEAAPDKSKTAVIMIRVQEGPDLDNRRVIVTVGLDGAGPSVWHSGRYADLASLVDVARNEFFGGKE